MIFTQHQITYINNKGETKPEVCLVFDTSDEAWKAHSALIAAFPNRNSYMACYGQYENAIVFPQ
jgi:hypothetical protein